MATIFILAKKENGGKLSALLLREGYQTITATEWEEGVLQLEEQPIDLLLINIDPTSRDSSGKLSVTSSKAAPELHTSQLKAWLRRLREIQDAPAIAIVPEESLREQEWLWGINDFIMEPYRPPELLVRIRRLLGPSGGESQNLIVIGDLVIDGDKYQVFLNNQLVPLTFKEFELLKFVASRPGKVFSRQTLLNQVWGYDYFGGERTVDVHIRRLRSKIEDRNHSFIDTVRNVGYRFKS